MVASVDMDALNARMDATLKRNEDLLKNVEVALATKKEGTQTQTNWELIIFRFLNGAFLNKGKCKCTLQKMLK